MTAFVTALYRALAPRRAVFFAALAAALTACALLSSRLAAHEDIRSLVPASPPSLADRFVYLQRAPFMHFMAITVGGGKGNPAQLAEQLAARLRGPELPEIYTGPGRDLSPEKLASLCSHAPGLLDAGTILSLGERLDAESIRTALRGDARQLLAPAGLALREVVALDPLNIRELLFGRLAALAGPGGFTVRDGRFTDASGRYALVLAKPSAPMSDALAAAAVMERVSRAVAELPPGTETHVTGSYRHTDANARIIKEDLGRILPVSSLLLAGLLFLFIRSVRALCVMVVPFAAVCIAAMATAAVYGSVSGIVLGFGSVLLGITADYAIHAYYAITGADRAEKGLEQLVKPLLAGAGTTAAAFMTLHFSAIPAIRQMSVFALAGLGAALLFALAALPHMLRSGGSGIPRRAAGSGESSVRLLPAGLLALLCVSVAAYCFATLRFDGDIRSLSYVPADAAKDEEAFRSIWRAPREACLAVAAGNGTDEGFERALRINDAVWDALASGRKDTSGPGETSGAKGANVGGDAEAGSTSANPGGPPRTGSTNVTGGFSGIAPLLPSKERQEAGRAAWRALWREHGEQTLARINQAAPECGFAPSAFAPFAAWMAGPPGPVTPETLRSAGGGLFLDMFVNRAKDLSFVYTLLPDRDGLDPGLRRALEKTGAHILSGSDFRTELADAAGNDIFRFCALTFAVVIGAVAVIFRSAGRCLAVLLPMLAGFAATLALFRLSGMAVNMFHAVALPLVIALSLDYGIFMQTALEGRMAAHTAKSVALSALTTLAGFGGLLLARHPALFSLGLTVTGGIAVAMAAALWLLPLLTRARPEKDAAAPGTPNGLLPPDPPPSRAIPQRAP